MYTVHVLVTVLKNLQDIIITYTKYLGVCLTMYPSHLP